MIKRAFLIKKYFYPKNLFLFLKSRILGNFSASGRCLEICARFLKNKTFFLNEKKICMPDYEQFFSLTIVVVFQKK